MNLHSGLQIETDFANVKHRVQNANMKAGVIAQNKKIIKNGLNKQGHYNRGKNIQDTILCTKKRKDKQMLKLIIGLIIGIYIGIIGILNLVDEDDYIRMLKAKAIKAKKEVKQWKREYDILDGIIDIKDAIIENLQAENSQLREEMRKQG